MDNPKRIYTAFLASVAIWCLSIIGAPLLHTVGGHACESVASILYLGFSRVCHQLDSRSLHLFGAKFGVCVRCTSIYFSFFAGVVLYPFIRPLKLGILPGLGWMALAVGPMVVDAALNDLGILQSNEVSRVVTGSISGFVFAFFIVPLFVEALNQLLVHRNLQGDSRYDGKTQ